MSFLPVSRYAKDLIIASFRTCECFSRKQPSERIIILEFRLKTSFNPSLDTSHSRTIARDEFACIRIASQLAVERRALSYSPGTGNLPYQNS